ncbi:sensor domain-containing diguanylate cyclase [Chitinivorax sp. B]|uniref:sensor domain-containing diguanylate cyclase n=1 Tax=Chitinivorax sp. B TaxID=2502235 RepID=UPI0010F64C02|nr:sensor domain-containing diguanylate cyclase [Chitinivorax sp. B]
MAHFLGGLRAQLTVLFGSLALLIGLLVSLYINEFVSAEMTRERGENIHQVARNISLALAENLREREREIVLLAQSPLFVKSALNSDDVRTSLNQAKHSYRYYSWIGVTDTQGVIQAAADGLLEGQNAAKRPWFIHGVRGAFLGDIHEAVLLAKLLKPDTPNEPIRFVDFASPIRDVSGQLKGVLASHARWTWVKEAIHTFLPIDAIAQGVEVYIVNSKREVLLPFEAVGKQHIPVGLNAQVPFGIFQWAEGQQILSTISPVNAVTSNDLGWQVVVRQPVATALSNVQALDIRMWLLRGITTAVLMGLVYLLSKNISQPIETLANIAKRIEQGDEEVTLDVKAHSFELSTLISALRGMTAQLISSKHELAEINMQLEQKVQQRTVALQNTNEELVKAMVQLELLARQDALTGLGNRMAANERLRDEFLRWRRLNTSYCVLLMDIDFFKKVNDTHGHDVGDDVLRYVARLLQTTIRNTDFVARFGGEEFLVLLPGTAVEGAELLADKICRTVAATPVPVVNQVTLSIGVAMASAGDAGDHDLVSRADQALYQAKHNGRNRVELATSH